MARLVCGLSVSHTEESIDSPLTTNHATDDLASRPVEGTPRAVSGESQASLLATSPPQAMEVDQTPTSAQHSDIPLQHRSSMSSVSSCCSVAESKAEIRAMLDNFQTNLNRVISTNLQEPFITSQEFNFEAGEIPRIPTTRCSRCAMFIVPSMFGPTVWYSCADCDIVVVSLFSLEVIFIG